MATKKASAKKATAPKKKTGPKSMSNAHKSALEAGRQEGRVVRQYLDALEANRPRRGRKRTAESIQKRLTSIDGQLAESRSVDRLHLLQERGDLEAELAGMGQGDDLRALEDAFVKVAKSYSERKGILYGTWRQVGVSAATLRRAGISRS